MASKLTIIEPIGSNCATILGYGVDLALTLA